MKIVLSSAIVLLLIGCPSLAAGEIRHSPPHGVEASVVPSDTPASRLIELELRYKAAIDHEAAWLVLCEAIAVPGATLEEVWGSVSRMILVSSDDRRISHLFVRFSQAQQAGFPGVWHGRSDLQRFARAALVEKTFEKPVSGLDEPQRSVARLYLLETIPLAKLGWESKSTVEVAKWKGWSQREVTEFASLRLVATDYRESDAEILGRTDDLCEPDLRNYIIASWNGSQKVAFGAMLRLIKRNDDQVSGIARAIRSQMGRHTDCGGVPCSRVADLLDWVVWQADAITMDPVDLFGVISSEIGSAQAGYARGDERRLIACQQLLRRGIDRGVIRQAVLEFVGNLNESLAPDQPFSRRRASFGPLKWKLVELGILLESDVPEATSGRQIKLPKCE